MTLKCVSILSIIMMNVLVPAIHEGEVLGPVVEIRRPWRSSLREDPLSLNHTPSPTLDPCSNCHPELSTLTTPSAAWEGSVH